MTIMQFLLSLEAKSSFDRHCISQV